MTSLPIPFFTAFLLVIIAGANHQQLNQTPTGRVFALFLYLNAVSMLCIGIRWSHGLVALFPIAAVLAVVSSALLYLAFRSMGRPGPVVHLQRDWRHLIPAMLIMLAVLIQPRAIDYLLIVIKVIYAALLMLLAKQPATSLQLVRLNWFNDSQHALWAAAALLLFSVGVDIVIAIDFALYEGRHAEKFVGLVNLFVVCLLGWASVLAGRSKVALPSADDVNTTKDKASTEAIENSESAPVDQASSTDEDDAPLFELLNILLVEQRLYADTELNLQKLARKAGVPARAVSRAINTHANKNVSQWVNSARIEAVCNLLLDKDVTVTQAMLESGFLTKSNFNREFLRLKGRSPSQWRSDQ